jgi:hypothetical protein
MLAEARKSKLVFDEEETIEFEVPMDKIGLVFGPKHAVKMQVTYKLLRLPRFYLDREGYGC